MKARLCIIVGWLVSNIHRIWNNSDPVNISPFPGIQYPLTVQWYAYFWGSKLLPCLILLAAWFGIYRRDYAYIGAVFALELLNYAVWYSTSEIVLSVQSILFIVMIIRKWK